MENEVIREIIAETRLPITTSGRDLGRHLANLKLMVSHRYEDPANKKRSEEERKALYKAQKRVGSLSKEFKALSNPESPLSRALRKSTFLAAAADAEVSPSLFRVTEFINSEPADEADRQLQEDVEFLQCGLGRIRKHTGGHHQEASKEAEVGGSLECLLCW